MTNAASKEAAQPDVELGAYVYCSQHVAPHATGWCSVGLHDKTPLKATTAQDAFAEVKALGLPIHGHCDVCYEYIANTRPYKLTCEEHDGQSPRERNRRF
jgi:hypothetical protein